MCDINLSLKDLKLNFLVYFVSKVNFEFSKSLEPVGQLRF